jgi:hypothetical protein
MRKLQIKQMFLLQVCCVTGEQLNEHNEPVALPNGMVYGANTLRALAAADGRVTCPRTGQTYTLQQAMRVYVM